MAPVKQRPKAARKKTSALAAELQRQWSKAVVRMGGGRGFVAETERQGRLVITAGHCLPRLPPSDAGSKLEDRLYAKLIGRLGKDPTVWAECVFVDPVADLAVLGSPDNQALPNEAMAYERLMEKAHPLPIGSLSYVRKPVTLFEGTTIHGPPSAETAAWVLSLDGRWFTCRVSGSGTTLWVGDVAEPIQSGMSGSPIVAPGGAAIGVISIGAGPNPELAADLPAWILRATGAAVRPDLQQSATARC